MPILIYDHESERKRLQLDTELYEAVKQRASMDCMNGMDNFACSLSPLIVFLFSFSFN